MGIFSVNLTLVRKDIFNATVFKQSNFDAMVDTGCTQLVINEKIMQELGLELDDGSETSATLASGERRSAVKFEGLKLLLNGLSTTVNAVVISGEKVEPLLGAIPLEDLNLMVIPADKKLLPIPETVESKLWKEAN